MATTEEQTFTTLAERIAALNKQKNFTTPPPGAGKRPPPPPPPPTSQATDCTARPNGANASSEGRSASNKDSVPRLPRRTSTQSTTGSLVPPLPSRGGELRQPSPALPPRRTSTQSLAVRRNSNSSDVSTVSASSVSTVQSYRVKAPTFDQAKLPPLPPSRREIAAREEAAAKEARAALPVSEAPMPTQNGTGMLTLPPRLPSRPARQAADPPQLPRLPPRPAAKTATPQVQQEEESAPRLPRRRLPPPPTNGHRPAPIVPNGGMPARDEPPPIPMATRPSVADIDAIISTRPDPTPNCLLCRDFTGPDTVASRHPTSTVPRGSAVQYLARVLCAPFPSPTDKARALFTWCHYNIKYDAAGFLSGNCFRGTVEETIFAGLSVCQGYAEVYRDVATAAGLECRLVSGHGYGYGMNPLAPGERPPPESSNHAWNVVKIDNGQWKLIDACWGAGHIGDDKQYHAKFSPDMFIIENQQFGLKHFPTDRKYQFREDARTITWDEYYRGPVSDGPRAIFMNMGKEGINEFKCQPQGKNIDVSRGGIVKFRFPKVCEHWDKNQPAGTKPRLLLIQKKGIPGREQDLVPVESDEHGWWFVTPAHELGKPGQDIWLYGLDTWNGVDARNKTAAEFKRAWGRENVKVEWICFAHWDLV